MKLDISNEDLLKLEIKHFDGDIYVAETIEQQDIFAKYLQTQPILGFDTETRPVFQKGQKRRIALLQLSSENKAYLIRVYKTGISQSIAHILENADIAKIGVGITDDLHGLLKSHKMTPQNFIDLQKLTDTFGIKDNSLRKMAAIILDIRVTKSQRLSNWEREPLTTPQKLYAATDAWVCYKMYMKLKEMKSGKCAARGLSF